MEVQLCPMIYGIVVLLRLKNKTFLLTSRPGASFYERANPAH